MSLAAASLPVLAPAVRLLSDPDDSQACAGALAARDDLAGGVLVCHLTPGARNRVLIAGDLLTALGKRPGALADESLTGRAWQLAGLWLAAERVRHLVLLRAHLLPGPSWLEIAELARAARASLWLVVHRPELDPGQRAALARLGAPAAATPWREGLTDLPAPRPRPTPLPAVPEVGFLFFRAAAARLLDPAAFTRVDEIYRAAFSAARTDARAWRGLAEKSQVALAEALVRRYSVAATDRSEALIRLAGAQAGLFREGLLLDSGKPPRELWIGPSTLARLRQLCAPASAAALSLSRVCGLYGLQLRALTRADLRERADGAIEVGRSEQALLVTARLARCVRAALIEHADTRDATTPLFTGATGALLAGHVMDRLLGRAAARAGVPLADGGYKRPPRITDLSPAAGGERWRSSWA